MVFVLQVPAGVTIEVNWFVTSENTGFPLFRVNTATLLFTEQTTVSVNVSVAQVVMVEDPPGVPAARPHTV